MLVGENIAQMIKRLQQESGKSLMELSTELDIPRTSLKKYASGRSNPRADTLVLLSEKFDVSIMEIISGQPSGWEQAEMISRAAKILGGLPQEKQEAGIQLLIQLAALFS